MTHDTNRSQRVRLAVILIVLGVLALMGIKLLWPLFIIGPGLLFLLPALTGGRNTAALSIPGTLITGTGLLLFLQNLTGYWESWAYAWTLYGIFLGLGLMLMGAKLDDRTIVSVGRAHIWIGAIAFVGAAFLAEIILGIGILGGGLGAVLLVIAGAVLLLRQGGLPHLASARRKHPEERLFTGPVVYGSTKRRDTSRLSMHDDTSDQNR